MPPDKRAHAERSEQAEPPRSSARSRPSWLAVGLAIAVGLGFLLHLRAWLFLCDDAFISFRYARNLGEHGALVYNLDPLEYVEGYTNFAWVVVLALGVVVGLAPEQLAPVLTGIAGLVTLLLVARISAELRLQFRPPRMDAGDAGERAAADVPAFEWVDLLAPALLVTLPEFVVWGSSGLETGVAVAVGLGAVLAWLRGKIGLAAALAGLAGLTRPDALGWVAAFGLAWLLVAGHRRRLARDGLALDDLPWRRIALGLAIFCGLVLGRLAFRYAYYGELVPNTWAVKHHGALLRDLWGVPYLEFWVDRTGVLAALPLILLLRPRHVLLVAPIGFVTIYAWSVGGDFMAYSRFLLPATVLGALLIGWLLAELRDWLQTWERFEGHRVPIPAVVTAVVGLAYVAASGSRIDDRVAEDRGHAHLHIAYDDDGRPAPDTPGFEGVQAMDRFAAVRLAAGARFAELVPPDTWISVGAAGAMPYASGLPAFDSYGLVDPGVVEIATPPTGDLARGTRPGHQLRAPLVYVRSRDPDLMCHIGWEGGRRPTRRDARRRAGPGWGWACVETGPIPDRRAESGYLDSRYYCCLRPDDRLRELDPGGGR